MNDDKIREAVRERYARAASGGGCCGPAADDSCCRPSPAPDDATAQAGRAGYSQDELETLPEGANLGLGCGNPVALAALEPGQVVLDLGSGAGIDCFLAADRVGPEGRVIGVDMTPEMVARARGNANASGRENVEFRLGEIERLPVTDESVDVVLSNCVVNLAPDKAAVFRETYRVLKPGGRLMISDIVLLEPLSEAIAESVQAYVGCVAGASLRDDYLDAVREAGFAEVDVVEEKTFSVGDDEAEWASGFAELLGIDVSDEALLAAARSVVSVSVSALKP